ncbi:MAG: ECF-type sigma factor [Planctomycetota bacterium]
MSDVTHIIHLIEQGDPAAAAQLLPLVYDELRRLAAAKLDRELNQHSMNATALVHEAYLRLVTDAEFITTVGEIPNAALKATEQVARSIWCFFDAESSQEIRFRFSMATS